MRKHEFESYRREFPITERFVYLDHAGVSPLSLRVKDAVAACLSGTVESAGFGYPEWIKQVVNARQACAALVNALPEEIAFVRSTSHGLSLVASGLNWNKGDNVLVYEKEFPSNIYPWQNLGRKGVELRLIPSRGGRIVLSDIDRLTDGRTRLLSLSSVQFTNGFRADLKAISALCRSRSILFCVDAIQSLGALPMDVKNFGIDFLSADAHKWLLGPEGIGLFYCRKELASLLNPPLVGWKSVERDMEFEQPDLQLKKDALRFEEGSLNLLGIVGLGAAVGLLLEAGIERIERRVLDLGDRIIEQGKSRGYTVLTPEDRRERGGIVTLTGPFDPSSQRDALRERGIMVNVRAGGLRLSPHFYTNEEDIDRCFRQLDTLVGS